MSLSLTSDAISGSGAPHPFEPSRNLLVVDDELSVRQALWITFRDSYQVTLAEGGPEAIQRFENEPVDVAIIDVRMPGMSGLEVLQRLKKLDPDVEVILLTAYERLDYIREAMRLGACDYITKPYQVDNLRDAVASAMERRAAARKANAYDKKLAQLQTEIHHQQMREELARTRNEIYASIIHDINGPLTVIAGHVELMQHVLRNGASNGDGDPAEALESHTQAITRQVTNCIELSRRYLGFLEGKAPAVAHAGVREVFYDVAELLKAHPHVRTNELAIQPFPEDVTVAINSTDLLQVLLNLTINGLQCTSRPHRVELYGRVLEEGRPRPFAQPAPNTRILRSPDFPEKAPLVAISVQDDGPGIHEGLLDRIFEPYFTTKPPGQGTGLGLSIVRRLVLQARGAVHVYSHLREGTVFTVYVPLYQTF